MSHLRILKKNSKYYNDFKPIYKVITNEFLNYKEKNENISNRRCGLYRFYISAGTFKKNYEVTVIDNFLFGQQSLLECCNNKNLKILRDDVRNQNLLQDEISKSDCIIPLACLTGAPLCSKGSCWSSTNKF